MPRSALLSRLNPQAATALGLTLILIGYMAVWLPGPGAGLSLIGLEMGEWIKFLPAVQQGTVGPRDWFYLPPVTLGLLMALMTWPWPNRRWQSWAVRGLAVGASLLAFPAVEALRFEPASEWRQRLLWIGGVMLCSGAAGIFRRAFSPKLACWLLLPITVLGVLLPAVVYLQLRPVASELLGVPVGIGAGLWLNALGHGLAAAGLWLGFKHA